VSSEPEINSEESPSWLGSGLGVGVGVRVGVRAGMRARAKARDRDRERDRVRDGVQVRVRVRVGHASSSSSHETVLTQPLCALRTRERVRERTAWQWLGSGPLSSRRAPASGGARDQRDCEILDPWDDFRYAGPPQAARVSVYLSICLSASVYLPICLSGYLTRVCLAARHEAKEAELATTEGRVLS
jgi:hypothetical protein